MVLVREIISRCAIDKKSLSPTCANALMASARRRRSTATGLIVAPRALRQRWTHTARAEPKCLLRKQFALGKPLRTSYNVICILLDNKMVVFSTFPVCLLSIYLNIYASVSQESGLIRKQKTNNCNQLRLHLDNVTLDYNYI